jgi:hypothetical protein
MLRASKERGELVKLDAGIASEEAAVEGQRRRVAALQAIGQDATQAQEVLMCMALTLEAWREHRRTLAERLERAGVQRTDKR